MTWTARTIAMFAMVLSLNHTSNAIGSDKAETLRVMSFNIWHGGESGKQPLDQTIKAIQEGKADLVGIQESHGEKRDGKRSAAKASVCSGAG